MYWHKIQVDFLTQSTLHSSDSFQKKTCSVAVTILSNPGCYSALILIHPHCKYGPMSKKTCSVAVTVLSNPGCYSVLTLIHSDSNYGPMSKPLIHHQVDTAILYCHCATTRGLRWKYRTYTEILSSQLPTPVPSTNAASLFHQVPFCSGRFHNMAPHTEKANQHQERFSKMSNHLQLPHFKTCER